MKSIALLVIFFCAAVAFDLKIRQKHLIHAKDDAKIRPRVVRGEEATYNQFPFMVGLEVWNSTGAQTCGGALISNIWVITAAHCLYGKRIAKVFMGSYKLPEATYKATVTSDYMMIEPYYIPTQYKNDIALLKVPKVTYSPTLRPIHLPAFGFSPDLGSTVIAPGWGRTTTNGPLSMTLLYDTSTVIPNEKCSRYYKYIDDTKLCTNSTNGGLCFGDSGGPLIQGEPRNYVLIGISSFTYPSGCAAGPPDGFIRVTPFLSWIHQITGI